MATQSSNNTSSNSKKNSKVKIITNKRRHNYWANIFERKRLMAPYFSDSAFGSQSDTKKRKTKLWQDEEKLLKFRKNIAKFEYTYDEMNEAEPPEDLINLLTTSDYNTYYNTKMKLRLSKVGNK